MTAIYHNIIPIFVFIFGAVVGSFLNVCIYRIPNEESIAFPASHCPKCNKPIRGYDNIPILSYILLGGKCRACKSSISMRYPLVELISALFATALFFKFGLAPELAVYYIFICALIVITFIDIDHYIIPDVISIPMLIIGIVLSIFNDKTGLIVGFKSSLLGVIAGAGFLLLVAGAYYLIKKKEGMGMGDVKLLGMLGAFLGLKSIFFIVFLSSILGALYGVPYAMLAKKDSSQPIPFGPFLAAAGVIYLFYGEAVIGWYLNLMYVR